VSGILIAKGQMRRGISEVGGSGGGCNITGLSEMSYRCEGSYCWIVVERSTYEVGRPISQ
jgi:hypothetical protein